MLKAVLVVAATLLASPVFATAITIPYTFLPGTVIVSSQVNANFSTIAGVVNGNLDNSNLSAGANISLSKLNNTQTFLDLQATGTTLAVGAGQTGDTVERIGMLGNGQLVFGPGGATAIDTSLTRTAVSTLQLNTGTTGTPATFDMAGGNIINASVGVPSIQGLRVTISSTLPVPADGTSTTLYVLPFTSGYISLYNASSIWVTDLVTSLSIAVPATTSTIYDVYVYDNSGVAAMGLAVWSGATPPTRGNQNGVPWTNGNKIYRWIGCIATNGVSGTTEDDIGARLIWNYNNQVPRPVFAQVATASWSTTSTSWRAVDANTTVGQGRAQILCGLANAGITLTYQQLSAVSAGNYIGAGIGVNSATAPSGIFANQIVGSGQVTNIANYTGVQAVGVNYYQMLEIAYAGVSITQYGNDVTLPVSPSALYGLVLQ